MTNQELDTCLELVRDRDRRLVIQHLRRDNDTETTVDALVDQLHGGDFVHGDDPPPDRDVLLAKLHHNHLPKLADHGVVEFNPTDGTVRYRSPDRIESVLDALSAPAAESAPRL